MDDLDEGNISAAAGKQGWAELFHTWINIKLYPITLNHKIFWNTSFHYAPFHQKKHEKGSL